MSDIASSTNAAHPRAAAATAFFFDILYPPAARAEILIAHPDARVSLWNRASGKSEHVPIGDLARAGDICAAWDAKGEDAYFGTCLRCSDLGPMRRGTKSQCVVAPGLWVDIDLFDPIAHASLNLPPSVEAALLALDAAPAPPTLVVSSGYGLHAYWLFDRPFLLWGDGGANAARFERLSKATQERVREIWGKQPAPPPAKWGDAPGWKLDGTADIPRVLRPDGTRNHKIPEAPRRVEISIDGGDRFTVASLEERSIRRRGRPAKTASEDGGAEGADPSPRSPETSAPSAPPSSEAAAPAAAAQVDAWIDPGPDPDRALPADELRRRLGNLNAQKSRADIARVLAGEPYAEDGDKDNALQRIAGIVAFLDPHNDPDALAEIVRPSWDAMRLHPGTKGFPPWHPDDGPKSVLDKFRRAGADARRARHETEVQNEKIAAGFRERAARRRRDGGEGNGNGHAEGGGNGHAAGGNGHALETPSRGDAAPPRLDNPLEPYSKEQIASFADEHGTTPSLWRHRWIIQRGSTFYVFCERGKYESAIGKEDLAVSLPRDLARAPIEWSVRKAKGEDFRRKTVAEILDDHATVARRTLADLTLRKSFYDDETETYHEAVCPVRHALEPLFDERIDAWLRFLGGAHAETLLDWIATITRLDRPSCALYLSGPRDAGKSMLAAGLAKIWTTGEPTELERILDDWTDDLTRCPLAHADERIAQTWNGKRTSGELRRIVATTVRTLTRKYQPNATLFGAVRVIMSANNDRMLAQLSDEDLDAQDLDAVAGRFLHIEVPQAAADFLRAIGGRDATAEWVAGDGIARHALWLSNRQVEFGHRFVVEGVTTNAHRALATQGKNPSLVCEWLARYLDKPDASVEQTGVILRGRARPGDPGRLLVNTRALTDFWDTYIKNKALTCPTTTMIGRTLANIALPGTVRVGNLRYRDIRLGEVFDWAERNQIGDAERMMANLEVDNPGMVVVVALAAQSPPPATPAPPQEEREPGADDEEPPAATEH